MEVDKQEEQEEGTEDEQENILELQAGGLKDQQASAEADNNNLDRGRITAGKQLLLPALSTRLTSRKRSYSDINQA